MAAGEATPGSDAQHLKMLSRDVTAGLQDYCRWHADEVVCAF